MSDEIRNVTRIGPPLPEQRAAVVREIGMRKRVYPNWVASGRMKQAEADRQLAAMEAVLGTLDVVPDLLARLKARVTSCCGQDDATCDACLADLDVIANAEGA